MPFRSVLDTDAQYALIAFDRDGLERPGESLTTELVELVRTQPVTDVFIQSHGWKGDVPAAIDQYGRWFKAFVDLRADAARMTQRFGDFRPLYIGVHWPSLPWGDEEFGDGSFSIGGDMTVGDELLEQYVDRLGDTPRIRRALQVIFDQARDHAARLELTPEAEEAYRELNGDLGMGEDGESGAPGDDREPFDPQEAFELGNEAPTFGFGGSVLGGVLGPLRQLSFWKMKDRARHVGETGMHDFVRALQTSRPTARVHLMGHSFGCIVASSIVKGPAGGRGLVRPVDSLVLVQGAMSIWSFSPVLPEAPPRTGYFHDVVAGRHVAGAIVTTQSTHDTAVGDLYPWAAGARSQVAFANFTDFPKYAALGAYGIRGIDSSEDRQMMPAEIAYGFLPGRIYNLESSRYIRFGSGPSGAHNDIDGREVAHTLWEAAYSTPAGG